MESSSELELASHMIISVVNGNTDGGVKGIEAKIDTNNAAVSTKLSALELRMQGIVDLMQQHQQHQHQQQQQQQQQQLQLQQQQQQFLVDRAAVEATAQAQTANTIADVKTMLENVIKKECTESRNEPASTVADMKKMLEKFIKKELTEQEKRQIQRDKESAAAAAAAAAAETVPSIIFAELEAIEERRKQSLATRDSRLFNTLEERQIKRDEELEERQIKRDEERKANDIQTGAALSANVKVCVDELLEPLMTKLNCINEKHGNDATIIAELRKQQKEHSNRHKTLETALKTVQNKLISIEQKLKTVHTSVHGVDKICKETKANVAAIRLNGIKTEKSVKSLEKELSSFIEAQDAKELINGDDDDDDDDIEGDDDTEDGEENIVDNATSFKRKRGEKKGKEEEEESDDDDDDDDDDTENGEEDSNDNTNDNRSEKKRKHEEDNNDKWMAHYNRLRKYCKNLDEFPTRNILDNAYSDFKLGDWVNYQRRTYKNQRGLAKNRVELLEKVSGWKWDIGAGRKRAKK